MDINGKRLALFDSLLSRGGLQKILDVAADILGNPLFVCDMGVNVVAKSDTPAVDDPAWSNDPSDHIAVIRSSAKSGDFAKMYATDEAFISSNPASPHRYLASRVRDGGDVLGHVVVIEQSKTFDEEDVKTLPLVCQVIAFELRGRHDVSVDRVNYGTIVDDLVEGRSDSSELSQRMERIGVSLPPVMRIMVLDLVQPETLISPDYLRLQVLRAFPEGLAIARGQRIIHIFGGSADGREVEARLARFIYTDGLSIGLSWPFSDLADAPFAYAQADAAVRLGGSGNAGTIAGYDEVVAAHIAELLAEARPLRTVVHPKLLELEEFDKEHGTDHVRYLHAYLSSGRSVSAAADMLTTHKNSMYYRVGRLEEIMGVDLSDERTCFLLQLSIALQGYAGDS